MNIIMQFLRDNPKIAVELQSFFNKQPGNAKIGVLAIAFFASLAAFVTDFVSSDEGSRLDPSNTRWIKSPFGRESIPGVQGVNDVGCRICLGLVVDESSSMEPQKQTTVQSVRAFIRKHQDSPQTNLTLVTFNGSVSPVIIGQPIGMVDPNILSSKYRPAGCTALNDAIAKTIGLMEENIKKMPCPVKPILAILTDGEENSSVEYKDNDKLKRLIQKKQENGWTILYLSSKPDENFEKVAETYGFRDGSCKGFDPDQIQFALGFVSAVVKAMQEAQNKNGPPKNKSSNLSPVRK